MSMEMGAQALTQLRSQSLSPPNQAEDQSTLIHSPGTAFDAFSHNLGIPTH